VVLTWSAGKLAIREHPIPPAVDASSYVIRPPTSCTGGAIGMVAEVVGFDDGRKRKTGQPRGRPVCSFHASNMTSPMTSSTTAMLKRV
jgi:hypothetical protein